MEIATARAEVQVHSANGIQKDKERSSSAHKQTLTERRHNFKPENLEMALVCHSFHTLSHVVETPQIAVNILKWQYLTTFHGEKNLPNHSACPLVFSKR